MVSFNLVVLSRMAGSIVRLIKLGSMCLMVSPVEPLPTASPLYYGNLLCVEVAGLRSLLQPSSVIGHKLLSVARQLDYLGLRFALTE